MAPQPRHSAASSWRRAAFILGPSRLGMRTTRRSGPSGRSCGPTAERDTAPAAALANARDSHGRREVERADEAPAPLDLEVRHDTPAGYAAGCWTVAVLDCRLERSRQMASARRVSAGRPSRTVLYPLVTSHY